MPDLVRVPITIPDYNLTEMSPIKKIGKNSHTFRPEDEFRERRKQSVKNRQAWFETIVADLYAATGCASVPFAFIDASGQEYYLDAGCVGIAVNKGVLKEPRNAADGLVREVFPTDKFWREKKDLAMLRLRNVYRLTTGSVNAPAADEVAESANPYETDMVAADIDRMAAGIQNRVASGGDEYLKLNPLRTSLGSAETKGLLRKLWNEQAGLCMLCGTPLVPGALNPLLQASPDRIDSSDPSYGEGNLQLAHLACNLAKNKFTAGQFTEWLSKIRSAV